MTDCIMVEIDGQQIAAKPNQTIIQVADEANIYIPRFCYHPHLTIAANCRMCLVEVANSPRLMPACALAVAPGLKVATKSAKTQAAQRAVMEFLLINHPLDCPICDQGGECELQDLSLTYGQSRGSYQEAKRAVVDPDLGPLIATAMTRCIQCTRCIRFGDEIAGLRELGAINRGEDLAITTYVAQALHSELSANMIDVCPVGALTAKPSRFMARTWELKQAPGISPHDCIGANVNIHTYQDKVIRVVPRANPEVNEIWLADRDRFGYVGLYHEERLTKPLIKISGQWQEVSWHTALTKVASGLMQIVTETGGDQLGALSTANATLEEFYLCQKLMRALGSSNVDHRLRQSDFRDQAEMPLMPLLGDDFAALSTAASVLLVGSNVQQEQPLIGVRLRQAVANGGSIASINLVAYNYSFAQETVCIVAPDQLTMTLAGVAKSCLADGQTVDLPAKLAQLFVNVTPNIQQQQIANSLQRASSGFILLGNLVFTHPEAATLRRLARFIAELTNVKLGFLPEGANAAGAWMAGMVPHRRAAGKINTHVGLNAQAMIDKKRRGYLLLHVEPDYDCLRPVVVSSALKQAELVVALTAFASKDLLEVADVLLPVAPFAENNGTFINVTGKCQHFDAVVSLLGQTKPGWQVLAELGEKLSLPDFTDISYDRLSAELSAIMQTAVYQMPDSVWKDVNIPAMPSGQMLRISEVPLYSGDGLLRRSQPLQTTQQQLFNDVAAIRLHPSTGFSAGQILLVSQQNQTIKVPVILDNRVPPRSAWLATGIAATKQLSDLFGPIDIRG